MVPHKPAAAVERRKPVREGWYEMIVTFVAKIDSYIPDMKVKYEKIIESTNPAELLEAIDFTNGSGNTPTVENLLVHLFVKGFAYCRNNYTITIR